MRGISGRARDEGRSANKGLGPMHRRNQNTGNCLRLLPRIISHIRPKRLRRICADRASSKLIHARIFTYRMTTSSISRIISAHVAKAAPVDYMSGASASKEATQTITVEMRGPDYIPPHTSISLQLGRTKQLRFSKFRILRAWRAKPPSSDMDR